MTCELLAAPFAHLVSGAEAGPGRRWSDSMNANLHGWRWLREQGQVVAMSSIFRLKALLSLQLNIRAVYQSSDNAPASARRALQPDRRKLRIYSD